MQQWNDEAFLAYLRENQSRFYRLAYSYVRNEQEALDLVQEAILRAYEKAHTLRSRAYLGTWFYRVLVNLCLDHLRRRGRAPEAALEEHSDQGVGAERMAEHLELYEALDQLTPELRTVVTLRFFEDMKLEEIAAVTAANLSTVKSRLYRALELLRLELEEEKGREAL